MLFDNVNGRIPVEAKEGGNNELSMKHIYLMHPEYSAYDYKRYDSQILSIRYTIKN